MNFICSLLFASALFGVAMFFFFRWVFVERYSNDVIAILTAFVCAVITWALQMSNKN